MDSQDFIEKCKQLVADYTNAKSELKGLKSITPNEVYTVWSTKVLQNNKALLSTPVSDGMYYELTFNGHKNELYFDAYKKTKNIKYDL
jgi:hypothetical protein